MEGTNIASLASLIVFLADFYSVETCFLGWVELVNFQMRVRITRGVEEFEMRKFWVGSNQPVLHHVT